jgi:hypothetical protein
MLVGFNLHDQSVLESIIEEEKPHLPNAAKHLHYLLATPFRYAPPQPHGSRFCPASERTSVFYGAEDEKTSCAEFGYWRLKMWLDSEGLRAKQTMMPVTLFEFHAATDKLLDLTQAPYSKQLSTWTDKSDYRPTQAIAMEAKAANIEAIRSVSVRNFPDGRCLIMLTPDVFKTVNRPFRHVTHTWNLFIAPPHRTIWTRELSDLKFEFLYDSML